MSERVIFMGTPEFAAPSLHVLGKHIPSEQLLVVTQPDRPSGRGRHLQAPPIKQHASRLGLDVLQVDTLRDPGAKARLTDFSPDLIVVAAFGLLLPKWLLELPPRGCVNLHASLLPRFRGASPIPAAIACGDSQTGAALMQMERGLDTGAVYATQRVDVRDNDTTASLTERLADSASHVLHDHLRQLLDGTIQAQPQQGTVVETRKVIKAHGAIDWDRPGIDIDRHIRAMWPWPRAWTVTEDGVRLQVHQSSLPDSSTTAKAGTIAHDGPQLLVATQDGWLRLDRIQLSGKSAQPSRELVGHPSLAAGSTLGFADGFELPDPWIVPRGDA